MARLRTEGIASDSSLRAYIKKSVRNCTGVLHTLDNLHLNYLKLHTRHSKGDSER